MILLGLVVAGACGALLRYEVELHVRRRLGPRFPYGTLLINVTGAFVLGLLTGLAAHHGVASGRGHGGRDRPARRLHHVLHLLLRHRRSGRAGADGPGGGQRRGHARWSGSAPPALGILLGSAI